MVTIEEIRKIYASGQVTDDLRQQNGPCISPIYGNPIGAPVPV